MKLKHLVPVFLLSLSGMTASLSATVTNQIMGVGPKNASVKPYFCIQDKNGTATYALAPGQSVDANQYSGNAYYVGGAIRFGGCTSNDSYLGYLGLDVNEQHNNSISGYSPPSGVHIAYTNPSIDSSGNLGGQIEYTPIKPNFNLLSAPPTPNANWRFVGINLSGLEFSKVIDPFVIPNLSEEDATTSNSDLKDTQAFLQAGMNTIRVPLSWGYLQLDGPGKGDINLGYFNSYVKPLLETLTSAHISTIVDLHAYMRYSVFGKEYSGCGVDGKCPDGTLILDPAAYQDVWTKLYMLIKQYPKINMDFIVLDLMNEPVAVPDDKVFTIQAAVIKSLRQCGFQGPILVEGNAWSGLHSWSNATWESSDGKTIYSNATLFTHDNFIKAGITDLSNIIINVHQYLDSDYSGTHDQCQTELMTTGSQGFNLNAFVDYLQQNHMKAIVTEFGGGNDSASCSVAITAFMNYLKDNAVKNKDYGFVGWTIWSSGHGWGNYNLRVTPTSYHMKTLQNYL